MSFEPAVATHELMLVASQRLRCKLLDQSFKEREERSLTTE
jgi:hypothetical protein